jgi:tRNA-dihydrouridine synthase B
MMGRAAIYNPWIFQQTKHFISTGTALADPTVDERFRVLADHLKLSVELKGEKKGVIEFRKHYSGYLKGLYGAAKVRQEMMQYFELEPALIRLDQYRHDLLSYAILAAKTGTLEAV